METKTITREDMAFAATSPHGCGFTLKQQELVKELGESAKAKWVRRMIGKTVPAVWWDKFVAAGSSKRIATYTKEGVAVSKGPVLFFKSQNVQHAKRELRKAGVEPMQAHEGQAFIPKRQREELFSDPVYKTVRAAVLRASPWCKMCGRRPPRVVLNVDHVIPLTVDWSRRMDPNNLQVLCEDCNQGKSNYWT